jgi:hypothetical protein
MYKRGYLTMNAVGIDVSKGKSTVTIRKPGGKVVLAPRDYKRAIPLLPDILSILKDFIRRENYESSKIYSPIGI